MVDCQTQIGNYCARLSSRDSAISHINDYRTIPYYTYFQCTIYTVYNYYILMTPWFPMWIPMACPVSPSRCFSFSASFDAFRPSRCREEMAERRRFPRCPRYLVIVWIQCRHVYTIYTHIYILYFILYILYTHTELQATFLSISNAAGEPKHPRLVKPSNRSRETIDLGPWVGRCVNDGLIID